VLGTVTHSLDSKSWSTRISARALDHDTPILLTTHPYWNLDAFQNPATDLVLNHTLSLPYGKTLLGIDPSTEATGQLLPIAKGSINDFWSAPKQLGASSGDPLWVGNCGTGSNCSGYNNQWVLDRGADAGLPYLAKPVASLSSNFTGIKWDLYSDQAGVVVYSCYWMGGKNFDLTFGVWRS